MDGCSDDTLHTAAKLILGESYIGRHLFEKFQVQLLQHYWEGSLEVNLPLLVTLLLISINKDN